MSTSADKIVQYLDEARAMELGLLRDLQAQIAMTPRGSYRTLLEKHQHETRSHADSLANRLDRLDHGSNPLEMIGGFAQTVAGQVLSAGKAPLSLVRGSSGDEKVLKNAKDSCAAEALEIATYIALERLAKAVGDDQTAQLAASIREDEERMLERLHAELPKLAGAVVRAEVYGDPSYDVSTIGAVDAVRETAEKVQETASEAAEKVQETASDAAEKVQETASDAADSARRASRQARKVPGVARAEGEIKGALASDEDLPIAGYDDLTAEEIISKLGQFSQIDLAKIDGYERRHQDRKTILDRIESLRGDEPWPGYDELTVAEIQQALSAADEELVGKVRTYERAHKNRAGVMRETERKRTAA